jgi:hypothetical protein
MARVVAYRFATEELPAGPVPMSSPRQTADPKLRVIYGTIEIPSGATLGIDDEPEWRAPTLLRELWRASAPGDTAEVVPGPVILDEDAPNIPTALLAQGSPNTVPPHWSTDPGEMAIFGLNDDGDKEYIDPDPGSMAVQAASDWEGQELPNTTPGISEPDHVVLQQTPIPPNTVRLIGGDDELAAATIGIDDDPPVIPRMGELPQNRAPIPPDDAEAFPITGALDDDTPPTWGLSRPGEVPRIQQFADDAVVAPTPIVDDESTAPAIPPHRSLWSRVLAFFLDPFELPGSVPTYPAIPYRALLLDTTPRVLLIDAVGIPIMDQILSLKRGSAGQVRAVISAGAGLTDLAGYAVRFHLRRKGRTPTLLDVSGTVESPTTDRIVHVDLSSANTNLWPGDYVGEFWLQLGGSDPIKAPGADYIAIVVWDDIDALP